jgi:hypothetical protein
MKTLYTHTLSASITGSAIKSVPLWMGPMVKNKHRNKDSIEMGCISNLAKGTTRDQESKKSTVGVVCPVLYFGVCIYYLFCFRLWVDYG